MKKILSILIFSVFIICTSLCCDCYANQDLEAQKKQTREKINRLKWLESLETNKLYNDNGFKEEEIAKVFIEELKASDAKPTVVEASKKNQKENAPLLYNLAENIMIGASLLSPFMPSTAKKIAEQLKRQI